MEWGRLSCAVLLCIIVFILLNIIDLGFAHGVLGKISIMFVLFGFTWLFMVDKGEKAHVIAYIKDFVKK